ncbi:thioredoxin [Vagococcus xieshaowenii]|uniref:Thioredoxin n=1 Tax=Vagococcus xieshaowenii TaxID=2562451 RepID=A0AAJ5JQI7_9ENTE|nr:thioredoxin [Vagococcus xieshaowenii]QCA29008.1 thioredoxin [Vagococcus xieshaowenii]TFZ41017.1 thioredoxin [Vagococcus xieshaowenii]
MAMELTDALFADETKEGLVLVDFWAPWCGPCRIQGPIIDELAEELEGQVKIYKMDVDENPEVPSSFGIMSIPTLLVKKDDQVVEKLIGVHRKEQLQEVLAKYM